MSRKHIWIGIILIVIVVLSVSTYLTYFNDESSEEYDWGATYSVEITADPDQSYSVTLPLPVQVDYQFFNITSDEDFEIKYVNETTAGFLSALEIESGNGTIEIVETDHGIGLQVEGMGNVMIVAEERGIKRVNAQFLDDFFGNHMSLIEENNAKYEEKNFSVHSKANSTEIGIKMRYRKWLSYKIRDENGNEVSHANESDIWAFVGIISQEGWTTFPGDYYGLACC